MKPNLLDMCRGIQSKADLTPIIEQFIESLLATIDNPQLSYLITPHWGARALSKVIINDKENIDARSLSPLFAGSGEVSNPLILNLNESVISRRMDYRRALREGYDSIIYTGGGNNVNAPLLLGDLTIKSRGEPTEIPVIHVPKATEGIKVKYSIESSIRSELYYDLVIMREGDSRHVVIFGVNVSPIFIGVESCKVLDALINLVNMITSLSFKLNYVIHIAINDEWGNPRFSPLYWGFSTVSFMEGILRSIISDLVPLTYVYLDSLGDRNIVKAPVEVKEALGINDVGELGFMESPGILTENYGYWPIVIKNNDSGSELTGFNVNDVLRLILSKLEADSSSIMSKVTKAFINEVRGVMSLNGVDDLIERINEDNVTNVKRIMIKFVYDKVRERISRVNLLNPTGFESMLDVATGEAYINTSENALEAELRNLKMSTLIRLKEVLIK
ncbi:hypothetical protein [Caldivirga maquilingensis]|uniref:hypothetical protein n=1 Tax=Caldivirga maquilingensis TaxID=76887 RepID=UPI0012EA41BB|nr:hypothetical protein [Caldivirga maquilingensis]